MTTARRCSKAARRLEAISRLAGLATGTVALLLCLASGAGAADWAPDWLRAAAQQKTDSYPNNPVAVLLLNEVQTTVQNNGEIDTRYRFAYRLLRPDADDSYDVARIDFDGETKVTSLKGWTIMANGQVLAVGEKDSFERTLTSYEVFTDLKRKYLKFPESSPGAVIGYEYVQKHRPFLFEDNWWFQQEIPVKQARFVLQLPPGWDYSVSWFNYAEQKPTSAGANVYTWEFNDVPAVEEEPAMPPWETIAGRLGIKYFAHDPALRARTTGSWNDLATWYAGLTQSSRTPSAQIQQKVTELTASLTDPVAKMRALTDFMQRQIRYVEIGVGIGGYQPHPAAEVFAHQYGDCKDKVTLLSSMLHEIGVESYYVLIDTDRGTTRPDYPTMRFDHAILAIRLADGIDAGALFASVNDPKLGKLLFFDPTDEYVPLGYLPPELQENYGLVVTPNGGELIQLPLLPPSTNRLLRTAAFKLTAAGDLSGDVHELEWGAPAATDREVFLGSPPAKRAEIFDHILANFLSDFTLTGASIGNLDQYNDALSVNYRFVAAGYANSAGDLLFVRPRVLGDKSMGLLRLFAERKPRSYPIDFGEATRQDDVFDITVPAGFTVDGLPQPVQADCDYASYHSETKFADGVLHYKRTFVIKDLVVPKEKLPAIHDFLQQVAADQQAAVVLRHAAQ